MSLEGPIFQKLKPFFLLAPTPLNSIVTPFSVRAHPVKGSFLDFPTCLDATVLMAQWRSNRPRKIEALSRALQS